MAGSRGAIDEAAAAAGLGRPGATFWSVRHIPPKAVWAAVGGAAAWGIVLGITGVYLIAPLVVPVVLIILAVVRHRATPVGGRRWLMLYEHGMAELAPPTVSGPARLRLVRWSDVTGVVLDPARPDTYALTLAAPAGQSPPLVRLADLTPAARLRTGLARHVPGVPWRAGFRGQTGVALTALGLAALAILPAVVPVARAMTPRQAAETAARPTDTRAYEPSATANVTAMPTAPASPAPPTATMRALPMPANTDGFYDVCRGTAMVPDAPAYSGPPPHPVYAPVPSYVKRAWWANVPSRVQLVVCTETSRRPGTKVRTCPYRSSDGTLLVQQLIKATWTVTIREARTGRKVAHSSVVGGDTTCAPYPDISYVPLPQYSKVQLSRPTDRQAYATVGRYVLS
ncbi:MAG TPA: hypothetical protein VFR67_09580 [Pilimelia sp.]|nr:hypothetical protein [Pilimelia sp.]